MARNRNGRVITGEEHASQQAAKYLRKDKGIGVSLYDMQKVEILKELFNKMNLEQLEKLQRKLIRNKIIK